MIPFRVLSHTADVRLRVFGHHYEELFKNAALALASVLVKESAGRRKEPLGGYEKIRVEGQDINILLVNFLNEVLAQSQINRKVYEKVKFLKLSGKDLEAQIFGRPIEDFEEDVKAVTYHDVSISQNARGIWETTLTLDI